MLASALEERERRFKLALRAGIPLIIMFSLLFYSSFSKAGFVKLTPNVSLLIAGLVFITIYFIYFLLELDVKETLLDRTTEGFNQETFIKKIEKYQPKTLAIISINNLTTINDNYGSSAINDLLHTFIIKLNRHISVYNDSNFWIGRNFGSEFLIGLDGDSQKLQNMLYSFVEENKIINTIEVDFRFSVISNLGGEVEKNIGQLRDQLKAQEFSKNHNNPPIKNAKDLSLLENNIIEALKKKTLNLYFRPLYNVNKKVIDSYEIYIKLKTNTKEILPRDYLPIVNRLGLGRTYDRIVLEHIVELALLTDDHISFSFNLSPFSLRDRDFLESTFNFIEEKKLNPERLIFEIYERKTHHDLGKYLKTLSKIRAKGIKICIDNFGSSNASMEYMKYFKFDIVQFDRDFVSRLEDKNNVSMLKSLIDMSQELNIRTVAKWVDKSEHIEKLQQLGIDYVQGFGVGKPLTEREVIQKYNK